MGIAHLVAPDPAHPNLVDQHSSGQAVIDDATSPTITLSAPQGAGRESHAARVLMRHTGRRDDHPDPVRP
jgi:hypothetical protein